MGIYSDRLYCDGWDWFENSPSKRKFFSEPSLVPKGCASLFGIIEVITDHHGVLIGVSVMSWGSGYESVLKTECGAI